MDPLALLLVGRPVGYRTSDGWMDSSIDWFDQLISFDTLNHSIIHPPHNPFQSQPANASQQPTTANRSSASAIQSHSIEMVKAAITKKRGAAAATLAPAAATASKKKKAVAAAAAAVVPSSEQALGKVETRVDKAQALRAAQALLQHHAKVGMEDDEGLWGGMRRKSHPMGSWNRLID